MGDSCTIVHQEVVASALAGCGQVLPEELMQRGLLARVRGDTRLHEQADLIQVEEGRQLGPSVGYRTKLAPEAAFRLPE